jgi:hypothetical protein
MKTMKIVATLTALALFAGAAMAQSTEVLSENVVGYSSQPLAANGKIISGAQFIKIGSNGLDLASIKLEGVPMEGTAFIQWWNGTSYDVASWCEKNWDSGTPWWGDAGDWEIEIKHTFAPGEGFWILVPSGVTSPAIKFANKVSL